MLKRIGISIAVLFLIGVTLITILGITLTKNYLHIPEHPNAWGWLEEYSADQEYFTVLEAYELILPLINEWNVDAHISRASAGYLWADNPTAWIQPDQRNSYWKFIVCSQNAGEWVTVIVNGGEVGLGVGDKPWGDIGTVYGCAYVKMDDIIDSNVAITIAEEHVGDIQPNSLHGFSIHRSPNFPDTHWDLYYVISDWGTINIKIDIYMGDILEILVSRNGRDETKDNDWKR